MGWEGGGLAPPGPCGAGWRRSDQGEGSTFLLDGAAGTVRQLLRDCCHGAGLQLATVPDLCEVAYGEGSLCGQQGQCCGVGGVCGAVVLTGSGFRFPVVGGVNRWGFPAEGGHRCRLRGCELDAGGWGGFRSALLALGRCCCFGGGDRLSDGVGLASVVGVNGGGDDGAVLAGCHGFSVMVRGV